MPSDGKGKRLEAYRSPSDQLLILYREKQRATATFVRAKLGLSLEAVSDDENPIWITDSELGEEEDEEILRFTEEQSRFRVLKKATCRRKRKIQKRFIERNRSILFRSWRHTWVKRARQLRRKIRLGLPPSQYDGVDRFL